MLTHWFINVLESIIFQSRIVRRESDIPYYNTHARICVYIYHASQTLHPIHLSDGIGIFCMETSFRWRGWRVWKRCCMYREGCFRDSSSLRSSEWQIIKSLQLFKIHQRKIKILFDEKVLTTKRNDSSVKENFGPFHRESMNTCFRPQTFFNK